MAINFYYFKITSKLLRKCIHGTGNIVYIIIVITIRTKFPDII